MDDDHTPTSERTPEEVEYTRLDRVPEWVLVLGAGCLFASTLLTGALLALVGYPFLTGEYPGPLAGLQRYSSLLFLIVLQVFTATITQAAATYFAWRGTNWTFVLLACLYGSVLIITIPLAIPAFLLLLVGKEKRYLRHE